MIDKTLIKYTTHALLQMQRRNITELQVLKTLSNPDEFKRGTHSTEIIAIKKFRRSRVRVIYLSKPEEIKIITVTH